jgi:hypothetical protein
LVGAPLRQCVAVGQTVAAIKIGVNSARLPDAYDRLAAAYPELAAPFAALNPAKPGAAVRPTGATSAPHM